MSSRSIKFHKIVHWIGFGVIILPGVTIGDGAVIGAGSVITKDIPPYGVVVGNPAKLIRKRFTEGEIKRLMKLKWWIWPNDKIRNNIKLLHGPLKKFLLKGR